MSEEEAREQRSRLLLELDDQKNTVAKLKERSAQEQGAFHAYALSFLYPDSTLEIKSEQLVISGKMYPLSLLDVTASVQHQKELKESERLLQDLQKRASALGVKLS